MSDIEMTHTREVYNVLDLLGDLGGSNEIFIFLIGIFIFPISEFGYKMKVLELLYQVDGKDLEVLGQDNGR